MTKSFSIFFILCASSMLAVEPAQPSTNQATPVGSARTDLTRAAGAAGAAPAPTSSTMQDGVIKQGGAILLMKNGRMQRIDQEMKLSEGLTVRPSGEITMKDGTRMNLQDGQMVTLDGRVTTATASAPTSGGASSSASGLTTPGASDGSSLGSGSNSTLGAPATPAAK